jgi:hypothetical protein
MVNVLCEGYENFISWIKQKHGATLKNKKK